MRKEECLRIFRVAQRDVAVGVDEMMVVKNVVCCYEIFEGRRVF